MNTGRGSVEYACSKYQNLCLPLYCTSYFIQVVMGQLIEKNWKDEDIKEDVEHVKGVLDEMLQDMSTFDSYLAEVRTESTADRCPCF